MINNNNVWIEWHDVKRGYNLGFLSYMVTTLENERKSLIFYKKI
jgi:hypothetical protein